MCPDAALRLGGRVSCAFELIQKNSGGYRLRLRTQDSSGIHTPATLDGSALCAEPPDNEFTFAKNAFAERARGRLRHVEPLHVLNLAAVIADEVVMLDAFHIESRGTALDGHFPHQASLHQVTQIVIGGGPRRARVKEIHALEDLGSGGMPGVFSQKRHHTISLWGAPQPTIFQEPFYRFVAHEPIEIKSKLRLCQVSCAASKISIKPAGAAANILIGMRLSELLRAGPQKAEAATENLVR